MRTQAMRLPVRVMRSLVRNDVAGELHARDAGPGARLDLRARVTPSRRSTWA